MNAQQSQDCSWQRHGVILAVAGLLAIGLGIIAFVFSGIYDIGADDHHIPITTHMLQILRERSIDRRSVDLRAPDLNDPLLILKGAGQYAAMCTQCHLSPVRRSSELRSGLYPLPPDLSRVRTEPKQAFWVIKHGIKMSAMPSWGGSHDDRTIWSMVAFLQKLPDMSTQQYLDLVAKAPTDDDED